ncbi:MAG TPA: response regulator [Terracidiphilus sp.]|nr:response regulator [Terracidiphilus sp.]
MRSSGPNALVISPCAGDHEFLRALFLTKGWNLLGAASLESARGLVQKARVVVTEADLHPGTWKDVLSLADAIPAPPLLIVVSVHADEYLWVEALNLGAYDVIAKPFNTLEVTRVMSAAWNKWAHSAVQRKSMGASARRTIARSGNHG